MDLFTYLMAKKGHNTHRDLFSYLLGKNAGGSGTYTTFSGTSLNISNTLQAKIKNIALEGNTSQDGTPTPDTPIPIKVVTGNQNVEISGKNLFDKDNDVTLKKQASFTGTEDNKFTTSSSNIRTLIIIKVPSNSEITLSINNDNYIQSRYFISQLKTPTIEAGKNERWYTGNSTIVTTDKTNYLGIVLEIKKNGTTVNSTQEAIDEMNIQIEEGTIATSYVPYQSQTYPLSLGDIELAKIGDYKDYIFKNVAGSPYYNANLDLNGWYLHKEIGKAILNGTESWRFTSNGNAYYISNWANTNNAKSPLNYETSSGSLSNYFINISRNDLPSATNGFGIAPTGALNIKHESYTTSNLEDFKSWLSSHNVQVYYILQNLVDTQITDTTLIQQLDNLKNARSYKGTTIIECTSESADNEVIGFSGDIKVTSVGLGNPLNTSLLSNEEPNLDDVNEIEDIEQNDEPIENEEIEEKVS